MAADFFGEFFVQNISYYVESSEGLRMLFDAVF